MMHGSKTADSGVFSKYSGALSAFSLNGVTKKRFAKMSKNPFVVYACFLLVVSIVHYSLGGNFIHAEAQTQLTMISAIAENIGLLALRRKIQQKKSVAGISGMTMSMYAVVYVLRCLVLVPAFTWTELDEWTQCVLAFASLLMVLDVRKSVFVTYRSTYQEELDVLDIKYLVPALMVLALVLHPDFSMRGSGAFFTMAWTSCLYVDVMALMPQVVMMAKGGGTVDAMISHFVAATVVSRLFDLAFWWCAGFAWISQPDTFNFSGWLIIAMHVIHLLLVADFMYYHVKAYFCGMSLSEDLTIDI